MSRAGPQGKETAKQLAVLTLHTSEQHMTKLQEVGAAADRAYTEANGVNQKIPDLQRERLKLLS
jgi:hypothetical protein